MRLDVAFDFLTIEVAFIWNATLKKNARKVSVKNRIHLI